MAQLIIRIGTDSIRSTNKAFDDDERMNRIVNLVFQSIAEEKGIDDGSLTRAEKRQIVVDWIADIVVDTARMRRRQNLINQTANSALANSEL